MKTLLNKIHSAQTPDLNDLAQVLSSNDEKDLAELFTFADNVRRSAHGEGILLRGIVEFSSYCRNACSYCGINKTNLRLDRYRMTQAEIIQSVEMIASFGIKTVVLQAGEDSSLDPEWLAEIIKDIKSRYDIAVTLSIGEWDEKMYRMWHRAGADRYLLKIETSDKDLYEKLHPGMSYDNRVACLKTLKRLGYQTGSGIIVGLKGQTIWSLAHDIAFFKENEFDMIGIGPFIPHNDTVLGLEPTGNIDMTLKVLALARIVTRTAHLPATTALGSANGVDRRMDGLRSGANVLMPNFTPVKYKSLYEIYPQKRCITEKQGSCASCMDVMARSCGRSIDTTRGDALAARKV
jgi:biotin synthase